MATNRARKAEGFASMNCLGVAAVTIFAGCLPLDTATAQQIEVARNPVKLKMVDSRWPLGTITAVVVDTLERVLVIGGRTRQELFLINKDGKALISPAQLSRLRALISWPVTAAFDGDAVIVADGQGPRWARLTIGRDWAVDTVSETNLSRLSGACTIGNEHFVMAKVGSLEDGGILHLVNGTGDVKRSFGKAFSKIANPAVGYGHLLCLPRHQSIVVVSRLQPVLRSYSTTGAERWNATLPGFVPMQFAVEGRLVRFVYPADSSWHQVLSLFSPASEVVAVQVGRVQGRSNTSRYKDVTTHFVSAATGALLGSQLGLPIVRAATKDRLFSASDTDELVIHHFVYRKR